ncbi:MAG TPA: low molecular weight protein arginine phosphatase [Bacillales bacterium]|nr:low molecular weight protein arginine phosphatase [Bacillales bacterium]
MKNFLFVCTGNTCRSPMAEALLRAKAVDQISVRSAGVFAVDGSSAAGEAVQALSEKGIDFQGHMSRRLDGELARWADVILTMTENHKRSVQSQFPETAGRVYTLREYSDDDQKAKQALRDLESCYAELEIQRSLSHHEEVGALEEKIAALEKALPSHDISDPFGGNAGDYRAVCEEIEHWIDLLVRKEGAGD